MARVVQHQKAISFNPVKRLSRTNIPSLDLDIFSKAMKNEQTSQGEIVLQLLATLAVHNPSAVISDRPWVADMLKQAGISDGHFKQPEGTDQALAVATANASSLNLRRLAGMTDHLGNHWTKTAEHILGNYGSYYNARHIVARRGYLALTRDQAFYPVYTGGNPAIPYYYDIEPHEAYVVRFSTKPKLLPTGFWSITVYDGTGYLVRNELDRYVLGDRSGLAYEDGVAVYGDDESSGKRDGPFEVLLQPADVPPPKKWMSNWLPAPAGGGKFSFSMRFYGAEESMSNGEWTYPMVTRRAAIEYDSSYSAIQSKLCRGR